ncbi:MAG: DUF4248 domain-containing protein [Bacteroidales bacterium]
MKEIALEYSPEISPKGAVKNLKRWIRRCSPLLDELKSLGYSPHARELTPAQLRVIHHHLGKP